MPPDIVEPITESLLKNRENIIAEAKNIFREETGEELTDEEIQDLIKNKPENEEFPTIIFLLALTKDALDIPEDLSVVFAIVGSISSVVLGLIIWLWLWGKLGLVKKYLIRKVATTGPVTAMGEFIPFFNMLPMATIFILLTHYQNTKLVRAFFMVAEKLESGGVV